MASTKPPPSEGNPAFKMAGLPSRIRLPSRNWLIFLSLVGGITGAITYDKRESKRIQAKWCARVASVSHQPLSVSDMPRRITVVLGTFPGDGIIHTREYFHEYVRPILHAGGMDWEVIEGIREGDVRAAMAEKIRRERRNVGEGTDSQDAIQNIPEIKLLHLKTAGEELTEKEKSRLNSFVVEQFRHQNKVPNEPGWKGDLVIGRHAWKEYIRGIHEGWLGSADTPARPEPVLPVRAENIEDDAAALAKADEADKQTKIKYRRFPLPSSIATSEYETASLSPSIPNVFDPVAAIPFPHLMGFLNSPIRLYRYFTRRNVTEEVGRQVAALILQQGIRPFGVTNSEYQGEERGGEPDLHSANLPANGEIDSVLQHEEQCWVKSVRQRGEEEEGKKGDGETASTEVDPANPIPSTGPKDYVWTEKIVLDSRIVERMRKFELDDGEILD